MPLRTHAEQNEIQRPPAERSGQLARVGRGGGVEIGRLAAHPMHVRRVERDVIEPEATRQGVVGVGIGRGHRPLVAPEEVDAPPIHGRRRERGKEGFRHRSARQCAGELTVGGDGVPRRGLEAFGEDASQGRGRIDDHLGGHDPAVSTRRSHG
jgi:hypothetical protein